MAEIGPKHHRCVECGHRTNHFKVNGKRSPNPWRVYLCRDTEACKRRRKRATS